MDFRIQGVIELTSRVGDGVRDAVGSLNELNDVVFNQWWGLQNIAGAFATVGGAAAAAMGMAAKEAIAWEESMADLERTVRSVGEYDWAAAENLAAISGGLRDVAASSPIAVSELAEIATQAGQLGVASADIAQFTKTVSELAYVTTLSTDEAGYAFARIAAIMEVPKEQYENLGSAILELGRGSASTESEIVGFATRLAGTSKVVGLSVDEVLALSNAMANLGIRAERGATAMQRTLFQMMEAVNAGGEDLQVFAQTAGKSAQEFADLWRTEPAEAITLFVEGLDAFGRAGGNADQILEKLGMSGIRQKEVLLTLAGASNSMVSANVRLRNSFELSANSMESGVAMAEIISQRYGTFQAQLGMLANRVSEVKELFGSEFLPVLQWIVDIVGAFVDGLQAVPAPIRNIMSGLTGFVVVVGGLTAAVFGLLPRLVMMRHSIQTLATTGKVAETGVLALARAHDMNALAAQRSAVAQRGLAASNVQVAGTANAAAGGAVAAGGASQLLARGAMGATRAIGIAGGALAVLSVVATIWGAVAGRSTRETEILGEAQMDLVNIMQGAQGNINRNSRAWIENQLVMANAVGIAEALGVEMAHLNDLVSGVAGNTAWIEFEKQMDGAGKRGAQLVEIVKNLHRNYQASAQAAMLTTNYNQDMADGFDDLTNSIDRTSDALARQTREQDKRNEAFLAYGDAVLSQKRAQFALQDAQDAYAEAMRNAQNPANQLRELEWRLRDARWALRDVNRRVADSEYALRNARSNQRRDLQDAEWDLADARYRYLDSLESVTDQEEKLRALRAGPTADELRDAVLKLEKAQVRLLRANQKVADSEWYLQYLREEGASERDIADAELILAEARVDVKESAAGVSDSEKDLADLRRGPSAEEIAKAERDLDKARRDSEKSLRRIQDAEREVAQLRRDVANDTAYKDAQRELERANYDLEKATYNLSKAQDELRNHSPANTQRDLAKAQLEVEEAAYNLAKANVEVTKQTALMNGEAWSAGHSARALADELSKLGGRLPRDVANNLAQVSRVLRRAIPTFEQDIMDGLDDLGSRISGPGGFGDNLGNILGGQIDALDVEPEVEGFWDKVQRWMEDWGWLKLGIAGATLGSIIPGVGNLIGGLIGGLGGIVIGLLGEHFFDDVRAFLERNFGGFFKFFGDIWREGFDFKKFDNIGEFFGEMWSKLTQAFGNITRGIGNLVGNIGTRVRERFTEISNQITHSNWYQTAAGWVSNIGSGIRTVYGALDDWGNTARSKLGQAFRNIGSAVGGWWDSAYSWGRDIIRGLGRGISGAFGVVRDAFKDLWDRFVNRVKGWLGISSPSTVFAGFGGDLIAGLAKGLADNIGQVLGWVANLPGRIFGAIGNVGSTLIGKGRDLVSGLWNGAQNMWSNFQNSWLGRTASRVFNGIGNVASATVSKGRDIVSGMWNGLNERWSGFVSNWLAPMGRYVRDSMGDTFSTMIGKGGDIISGMWNGVSNMWNNLKGNFSNIGRNIANAIGGVFNFGSPSRLMAQWGEWIIEGLMKGLDDEKSRLSRLMDEITSLMVPKDLGTMAATYQPSIGALRPGALQQALGGVPAALMAQLSQRQGDSISVHAETNADPHAIASEVAWSQRIRTRN